MKKLVCIFLCLSLLIPSALAEAAPVKLTEDVPCFAVLQYGGLYAYLITFYPMDNGKVSVCGQVIPSRAVDELNIPLE